MEGNEKNIKREGVCAASLPTTMGITAGFLVQAALKILLKFGEIAYVLGYNATQDYFTNFVLAPNPDCKIKRCRELQGSCEGVFGKERQAIIEKAKKGTEEG